MTDLALALPWIARDAEALAAEPGKRGHPMGARRVEPDKQADGFEDGRFSLSVVAGEDGSAWRDLQVQ